MAAHMDEAEAQLQKVHAALRQRLVLDSELDTQMSRDAS